MLQIFNKKKFLVDNLEGFIDIHNHILPGIDDGAKTVENSLELIKTFTEIGCSKFIATPHIMHNYYPNDIVSITKAYDILKNAITMSELQNVDLSAAAEHMIDSNFEDILEQNQVMPLAKTYILIEMSYLQPSINFEIAVQKIASNRLFPILAHPERYVFLHNRIKKYRKYKDKGILFQLNLLSLTDFYGKEVQKTAHKLLEEGLIDFIASDVHNMNQLNTIKSMRLSNKTLNLIMPIINKTIINFS
ncbi:histidinol phosphatase [Aurantibacter crassamenti]|uniref:tyrosine-protein phosphatase n=1 Tax=Aurantibacter crassamenti TaxID=1837375 RepID=UPI00193ADC44|nr:CpsB/CapC family capsule biosynthesis tyrosine phosphatase [Aurantibacter crassamenti]MBM1106785.1 histidinol phosphatase [Aurantibacter crassamenti]